MSIDFRNIPSPCFIQETSLLEKNMDLLSYVKKETGAEIISALKGYAMWSTFDIVRKYLDGAAASSLHEARLCFEELKIKAHSCCPVYIPDDFEELMSYSSHISFNSYKQWEKYRDTIQKSPYNISCGLRINPEYSEVATDLYNPCMPSSRLGISIDKFGDYLPDGIEGIHFHSLCENDSYVLERTLKEVEKKFGHLLKQAKWINMGGGHHITKNGYDISHLIQIIKDFRKRYNNIEVILEPGEAIGWETGVLVSTILDIVDNKGINIAILDTSFAAHMPDCLEMPYKPRIRNSVESKDGTYLYHMGGISCLSGDFVGDYSFATPLSIGDKIIFEDMIHYTMVKTTTFNGINLPSIGIIDKNNDFKLIKSFGYEDYRSRLS